MGHWDDVLRRYRALLLFGLALFWLATLCGALGMDSPLIGLGVAFGLACIMAGLVLMAGRRWLTRGRKP